MEEVGVTRTAVTEQLHDLMQAGYVERIIEHLPGRGRPRHLYSATPAALVLLFASNQQLVVPAIWGAIRDAGGDELTERILRSVTKTLLEHYRAKITATEPEKRLAQYRRILEEEGGLVDLRRQDGELIITKRTCPFISMFEDERNVCTIDVELMASIAGCPVEQISCRHDGDACCRFRAKPRRRKTKQAAKLTAN